MVDLSSLLIQALVYPGLTFTIILIIVTQWLARKIVGRVQFRREIGRAHV